MRIVPKVSFSLAIVGLFLATEMASAGLTGDSRLRPGRGFHNRPNASQQYRPTRWWGRSTPSQTQYYVPRATTQYRTVTPSRTVSPQYVAPQVITPHSNTVLVPKPQQSVR